ncbi:MAG: response regulator [Magnetococcales bacterium]|nr:response regulator [Magnetococcales bacterium]
MADIGKKAKILIVDDIPANIKILAEILKSKYDILMATSGAKALQAVANHDIGLVLLDIEMPQMDGYEVCRRLKADTKTGDIPVIFVTAKIDMSNETMGFEVGAVDYITKPISPPVVIARIQTHLQNRELNLSLQNTNLSLEKSNDFIRKTFGRYMSDEVVENILDSPEGLRLGGEKKFVTVMMTDLRGFTAIGERLSPEEVISMLNMYLEIMTQIIFKYKGTIIEFLGDGILALFGAPVTRDDDAQRAVACALEMQQKMPEVNRKFKEHGYEEVTMGGGLNTGQVVAGNIGSDLRSKYGVVGNAINLAARIESFTVGGQILISENTLQACTAELQIDDQWSVRAKGLEKPIAVYQIGGISEPYNIHLPQPEKIDFQPIKDGPTIRLTIIEGKVAERHSHDGKLIALVPPLALISTTLLARKLTDIQVELVDKQGLTLTNQLYGKILGIDTEASCMKVQFTSIPPEANQIFQQLLGTNID